MKRFAIISSLVLSVVLLLPPVLVQAAAEPAAPKVEYGDILNQVGGSSGLGDPTSGEPKTLLLDYVGTIINVGLGLLGAVLLILTIYAGFLWMTAGGNDEQVTKAKAWIRNAVIGLIITLAAYSIANFVVKEIGDATVGSTSAATEGGEPTCEDIWGSC